MVSGEWVSESRRGPYNSQKAEQRTGSKSVRRNEDDQGTKVGKQKFLKIKSEIWPF
jgi:hypothetical protein